MDAEPTPHRTASGWVLLLGVWAVGLAVWGVYLAVLAIVVIRVLS